MRRFLQKYRWSLVLLVLAAAVTGIAAVYRDYGRHASPERYIQEIWGEYSMVILCQQEITAQDTGEPFTLVVYRTTGGAEQQPYYGCLFKKSEPLPGLTRYTAAARCYVRTDDGDLHPDEPAVINTTSLGRRQAGPDAAEVWFFFGLLNDPNAAGYAIGGHPCAIAEATVRYADVLGERRLLYLVSSQVDGADPALTYAVI